MPETSTASTVAGAGAGGGGGGDDDRIPIAKVVVTIVTVTAPLALYFVVPFDRELGRLLAALLVVATVALLMPLAFHQARLVLRSDHPVFDAVRCIVTGVVLLVVSFSSAYFVLGTEFDGQIQGLHTKLDGVYFTMTILSTVGFGDISATGQTARCVVVVHMAVNFALAAVALRVVSWALRERQGTNLPRRLDPNARPTRSR